MRMKSSFLSKLLLTYLIVAIIPLICIITILFSLKWKVGKQEMQSRIDYTAKQLNVQLESIRDAMSFISLDVISNEQFVSSAVGLTYDSSSYYERTNYYLTMVSIIGSYSYTSSAYQIIFFNDDGYYMTNEDYNRQYNYAYRLDDGILDNYDWIHTARTNYGKEIFLPVSDGVLPNVDTEVFSLVRAVRSPGKVVGYLAIQISGESLLQLWKEEEMQDIDIMIWCGEDILYKSEDFPYHKAGIEDIQLLEAELGRNHLVSTSYEDDSHICVMTTISMENVLRMNGRDFAFTGMVVVSVIVLTLVMIFVFSHRMSKPLIYVTKKMQDTTVRNLSDKDAEMMNAPFREVQILYSEFYRMRQRLDGMIENEIALMTLQTKERLNYLQAQINPHFLYNTLNIIGIMGLDVGDNRIYNSCQMLSRVLKYSMTEKESAFATFEEEIRNTEMYLNLMKLRFEDKLSFAIECDTDMRSLKTIRIILQPFVENIFEHGFDAEHTDLDIWIRGYVKDGKWHILIRDNGAGMDEKSLYIMKKEIAEAIAKAKSPGRFIEENANIGIKNTLIRLALFYGEDFRYSINNISFGGFLVTLEGGEGGPIV